MTADIPQQSMDRSADLPALRRAHSSLLILTSMTVPKLIDTLETRVKTNGCNVAGMWVWDSKRTCAIDDADSTDQRLA